MKSILSLCAVLALLLIASTSHARPGTGGYWHVVNDEAMPMIQALVAIRNSADSALSNKKSDTKVAEDIVHEKLNVDPIPDISIYHGDSHNLKGKNSYVDESDPIPDFTIYHGDSRLKGKNTYVDGSDPLPDISIYHGDSGLKEKTPCVDKSDPIPDTTIYHGDSRLKGKNIP